jgi:hypothetical protein
LKKIKKILVILLLTIVLVPAFILLGICTQSFYLNMNPDHVNLNKDGWVKVISFTTIKNKIPVEIYGKPGKEANSGEFVILRRGVLPFKMVSITSKYFCNNLWDHRYGINDTAKNTEPAKMSFVEFFATLGTLINDDIVFKPTPSIFFGVSKLENEKEFKPTGICYVSCDYVPIINRLHLHTFDTIKRRFIYDTYTGVSINSKISDFFIIPESEEK